MRVLLLAVGRMKKGPETELVARYLKRAEQAGRQIGLRGVEIIEIRESRASDAGKRMIEESIALANVIPEGAVTIMLDETRREPRQRRLSPIMSANGAMPEFRRPFSSSAGPTGWRRACATKPS